MGLSRLEIAYISLAFSFTHSDRQASKPARRKSKMVIHISGHIAGSFDKIFLLRIICTKRKFECVAYACTQERQKTARKCLILNLV